MNILKAQQFDKPFLNSLFEFAYSLKLETQGLDTALAQGDILFPATGFDATGNDAAGDIWGSFTIVLKTLIP